jgi:hypothetical protein
MQCYAKRNDQSHTNSNENAPIVAQPSEDCTVVDDVSEQPKTFDHILELLPKLYRNRARVILNNQNIKLEDHTSRIIYNEPNGAKQCGSHIADLIMYHLSPTFVKSKSKLKPPDYNKFKQVLASSPGIPCFVSRMKANHKPVRKANHKPLSKEQPNCKQQMKPQHKIKWINF